MTGLEKVFDYLDKAGVFFVATEDGDRPKCRPFGFKMLHGGRLYFGVGTFKDCYKQLQANPKVEICANVERTFLRYYGTAVFDADPAVEEKALELAPHLRKIYNAETGYHMGMFYLKDATAEFRDLMKITESVRL